MQSLERLFFHAGFCVENFTNLRYELKRLPTFEELAARGGAKTDDMRLILNELWQNIIVAKLAEVIATYSEELDAGKVAASAKIVNTAYVESVKKENKQRRKRQKNERGK